MLNCKIETPDWLTKAKTVLLPKDNDTRNPKNYCPIALQNIAKTLHKMHQLSFTATL